MSELQSLARTLMDNDLRRFGSTLGIAWWHSSNPDSALFRAAQAHASIWRGFSADRARVPGGAGVGKSLPR